MTLSPRQLACLQAYAETGDYRRAAEKLGLHYLVIRNELVEVRAILEVDTSVQAFCIAIAQGWIEPADLGPNVAA